MKIETSGELPCFKCWRACKPPIHSRAAFGWLHALGRLGPQAAGRQPKGEAEGQGPLPKAQGRQTFRAEIVKPARGPVKPNKYLCKKDPSFSAISNAPWAQAKAQHVTH